MKIISGKYRGRNLLGFDIDGTRPTMDRVKESIFGMIQSYVNDSVVLDLFSGTGNLGIEAISNGAKMVYFNDFNKHCINVINENIECFNIKNNAIVTNLDYKEALKYYQKNNLKFNIIFLDPPYKEHIINEILEFVLKNNLLINNGLIVCEVNQKEEYISNDLILLKEKKYGDKMILIYKFGN